VEVAVVDHPIILFRESEILPAFFHAHSCCGQRYLPHFFTKRARNNRLALWLSECVGDPNYMLSRRNAVTTTSRYLHFDNIELARVHVHANCSCCGRDFAAEPMPGERNEEVVLRVRAAFNKHDCSEGKDQEQ
jgi:hypothetical protein